MNKLDIPYNKVALKALMQWNGLSQEEAEKFILENDFEEIESKVFAKNSMESAISAINEIYKRYSSGNGPGNSFKINSVSGPLRNMVFRGTSSKLLNDKVHNEMAFQFTRLKKYPDIIKYFDSTIPENIIEILSAVHDGWVKDNAKSFFTKKADRKQQYQFLPLELIGWEEAKSDLLFVQPILESLGIEVKESELEQAYNKRVKQFFLDRDIKSEEDLVGQISMGAEFYPALKGEQDIVQAFSDETFVRGSMMPQIKEKGIGSVDSVRKNIVIKQVAKDPLNEDIERLTDEEVFEMESNVDKELSGLQEEYRVLTERERAVQRFKEKIGTKKEIEAQIAQIKEEQRKKASQVR